MNCLEAKRVLKTLEEAVERLKELAYVRSDPWPSFASCQHEVLGKALQSHRKTMESEAEDVSFRTDSSLNLLRVLKDPEALKSLHLLFKEPQPTTLEAAYSLEKLIVHIKQQLSTSVEEDRANALNFASIKQREQEAIAEQKKLEQVLKLERIERQRQLEDLAAVEHSVQGSLDELHVQFSTHKESVLDQRKQTRDEDHHNFKVQHERNSSKLEHLKKALSETQLEQEKAETELREVRRRQIEDIEVVKEKFESQLAKHEEELQTMTRSCHEVQVKAEESTEQLESLIQERLDFEEQLRKKAEEAVKREKREKLLNKAACLIQSVWKNFKAEKHVSKQKASKKSKK